MGSHQLPRGGTKLIGQPEIHWRPSPNFGARRNGLAPELIVIHYTAMRSAEAALERLCDPNSEVSAHYLISAQGDLFQMVDEAARAWHAGAGSWQGREDVNSRSIGIELDNSGQVPFAAPQMQRLEELIAGIMSRWGLGPMAVIGHSDMAPDRKYDPGPRFDWARLAKLGLANMPRPHHPPPSPDEGIFRACATAFGFPTETAFGDLLRAVRDRFAPWHQGPLHARDMAIFGRPEN